MLDIERRRLALIDEAERQAGEKGFGVACCKNGLTVARVHSCKWCSFNPRSVLTKVESNGGLGTLSSDECTNCTRMTFPKMTMTCIEEKDTIVGPEG